MLVFVIRRFFITIPVLIASSLVVYLLVAEAGDPLGNYIARNPKPSPSDIALRRKALGLDENVFHRWFTWLTHFVQGNFGASTYRPVYTNVRSLLFDRLEVTARLVVIATLLAVVLAMLSGVLSAIKQYSALDYGFTFLSFIFLSVPVFFFAGLLSDQAVRQNQRSGSSFFKVVGDESPNLTGSFVHRIGDYAGHLVLPTIALTLITYPSWSRFQRASMLEVLSSDYIRLARAKGLSRARVTVRHALRTALIPLATVVSIDVGAIFGGAVLTENVFNWQGMGNLLTTSVENQDLNPTLAWLMASAVLVILFNLLADLLYAVLDPRIRL